MAASLARRGLLAMLLLLCSWLVSGSSMEPYDRRAAEIGPDGSFMEMPPVEYEDEVYGDTEPPFSEGFQSESVLELPSVTGRAPRLVRRQELPGVAAEIDMDTAASQSAATKAAQLVGNIPVDLLLAEVAKRIDNVSVDLFDCAVSFDSWQFSWSRAKMEWCCKNHDRGCPPTTNRVLKTNTTEPCTTVDCRRFNSTASGSRWTGTQVCEGHGFSVAACSLIGCCKLGERGCLSAVGDEQCTMSNNRRVQTHGYVSPIERKDEAIEDDHEASKHFPKAKGSVVCENHGWGMQACVSLPCCLWDPARSHCYSAVGEGPCDPAKARKENIVWPWEATGKRLERPANGWPWEEEKEPADAHENPRMPKPWEWAQKGGRAGRGQRQGPQDQYIEPAAGGSGSDSRPEEAGPAPAPGPPWARGSSEETPGTQSSTPSESSDSSDPQARAEARAQAAPESADSSDPQVRAETKAQASYDWQARHSGAEPEPDSENEDAMDNALAPAAAPWWADAPEGWPAAEPPGGWHDVPVPADGQTARPRLPPPPYGAARSIPILETNGPRKPYDQMSGPERVDAQQKFHPYAQQYQHALAPEHRRRLR